MNKILKYTLLALMWSAVAAYIVWSAVASRRSRAERKVTRIEIEVADSSSQGHLVSSRKVREWLRQSSIKTVGANVDAVNLSGLEALIAQNGFVDKVRIYITYAGVLKINISQRRPVVRLLTDGRNAYATEEGYVFTAPYASSLYVPVVTGSYQPPFPTSQQGTASSYVAGEITKIDDQIAKLERDKSVFYDREWRNDHSMDSVRRLRVSKEWWRLESRKEFESRAEKLRGEKQQYRRHYRYQTRLIQEGIEKLEQQQERERLKQKKIAKNYEDFMKLLTFVEFLENDDFWRAEIVQIIAHTTSSGALEVDLIPRSGRHTILFGRLEEVERKFDKLLNFYRRGLTSIGWDEFRTINVKYNDQVVCMK